MHTIGFFHEHSRLDRDSYVNILWPNIPTGKYLKKVPVSSKCDRFSPADKQHNFYTRDSTAFGVQYDYGSVMHYSAKAFSSNGMPTIETKVN